MNDETVEVVIHEFPDRDIHILANHGSVGVCYYVQQTVETITVDGVEYSKKPVRRREPPGQFRKPYIGFFDIGTEPNGSPYIREDSIADGGFLPETAEALAAELLWAAQYLREHP